MKITQEHQKKGQELYQQLVQKAWESASFKEQLIENPVAAISNHTGRTFATPDDKQIVVQDQTDENVIYLNIPAKADLDNIELSDEELETVAGGTDVAFAAGIACVALFYAVYSK